MKGIERMKRGLRWLLPSILGTAMLGAMPGCYSDDDYDYDDDDDRPRASEVGIDEGATLQADPGEGVGVFIEYAGEGRWQIWTTCDTELSGVYCQFDIYLKGDDLEVIDQLDLEGFDYVSQRDDDEVHAYFENDYDTDGITIKGDKDEPLSVEIWIDGVRNGEYAFWVENGNIVQGLPSNPTVFNPDGSSDPDPPKAVEVGIEEGRTFSATPGAELGLYTEYLGNGRWNVWSTCDTEITNRSCTFDFTAIGKDLTVISDLDLEDPDYVEVTTDRVQAHYETSIDTDGIILVGEEDAPLTLEVWLNGEPNGQHVFWHNNDTVNHGLPSNPTKFVPNL